VEIGLDFFFKEVWILLKLRSWILSYWVSPALHFALISAFDSVLITLFPSYVNTVGLNPTLKKCIGEVTVPKQQEVIHFLKLINWMPFLI
jgi:hypothetical protein